MPALHVMWVFFWQRDEVKTTFSALGFRYAGSVLFLFKISISTYTKHKNSLCLNTGPHNL
jgi:hypothetical protein